MLDKAEQVAQELLMPIAEFEAPTLLELDAARLLRQLAKENEALRTANSRLEAMLVCVDTNLCKGMSRSIQRLQAKEIRDEISSVKRSTLGKNV
jgi:hypothetical protein